MTARRRWWSALATDIETIHYNFATGEGTLRLPPACTADMSNTIDMFRSIDPDVRLIRTFAGREPVATFSRLGHTWDIERQPLKPQVPEPPRRRSGYGRGRSSARSSHRD